MSETPKENIPAESEEVHFQAIKDRQDSDSTLQERRRQAQSRDGETAESGSWTPDQSSVMPNTPSIRGAMSRHPFITAAAGASAALLANTVTGDPAGTLAENLTTPDIVVQQVVVHEDSEGWIHAIQEAGNNLILDQQTVKPDSVDFDAYKISDQIPDGADSILLSLVDEGRTGKIVLVGPDENGLPNVTPDLGPNTEIEEPKD